MFRGGTEIYNSVRGGLAISLSINRFELFGFSSFAYVELADTFVWSNPKQ